MRHADDLPDDVPAWIKAVVATNVGYVHWGPHEDYMCDTGQSWASRILFARWSEMFGLDDLNEVASFYWSAGRENEKCGDCDGSGYNPETHKISESFYSFDDRAKAWNRAITEDEVEALRAAGRVRRDGPHTAAEFNATPHAHDAINRSILIEARAKRLGVWGWCEKCDGEGYVYTSPDWRLVLTLWVMHPRKGASRGVEIADIKRREVPAVVKFLTEAAERNAGRFANIAAAVEAAA